MDFLTKLPVGHSLRPENPTVANSLGIVSSTSAAKRPPATTRSFVAAVDNRG